MRQEYFFSSEDAKLWTLCWIVYSVEGGKSVHAKLEGAPRVAADGNLGVGVGVRLPQDSG